MEGRVKGRAAALLLCLVFLSIPIVATSAQIGAAVGSQPLAGVWTYEGGGASLTLLLKSDGTGEFNGTELAWQAKGATLTLSMKGFQPVAYAFVLAKSALTLSGGDLAEAITFTRAGSGAAGSPAGPGPSTATQPPPPAASPAEGSKVAGLEGIWEGYGETIEFRPGGAAIYLGQAMRYTVSGSTLTLVSGAQSLPLGFAVNNNQLILTVNGARLVYSRSSAVAGASAPSAATASGRGIIAPELVGTWAYVDVTSTNTGGISSSARIVINADGTYLYQSEGSISVNTPDLSGGTASQGADRGTWRLDGDILHVQSQTYGAVDYRLEKRNHPKTGDPMIVLDGKAYVTYYQKAPWR